jgi:hypothetical protein
MRMIEKLLNKYLNNLLKDSGAEYFGRSAALFQSQV